MERRIGMVKQNYTNFSPIIGINDSGHDVDFMFEGKARMRCNSAIGARWELNLDTGGNEGLVVGGNVKINRCVQVETCSIRRAL